MNGSIDRVDFDANLAPAEMVRSLMPVVRRVAAKMARSVPSHILVEDLVAAGTVGLLEATRRFEPGRAESFVGYATLRIRGAMLDELRRGDILSQEARLRLRQAQAATAALQARLNREPDSAEVAAELGLSEEDYLANVANLRSIKMVHVDLHDDEEAVADDALQTPFDVASAHEEQTRLAAAIGTLPEREKLVLSLYYEQELTYKEIGQVLDLTAARICQIHTQATARLRGALTESH